MPRSTPARPRPPWDQAALTSIVFRVAACGAGTLTSSIPFAYFASTWAASTPRGAQAPLECAVRELADEVVLARAVGVGLALALDGEDVVHPGHLDVLRIHARQGELDDVGVVGEPPLSGGERRPAG